EQHSSEELGGRSLHKQFPNPAFGGGVSGKQKSFEPPFVLHGRQSHRSSLTPARIRVAQGVVSAESEQLLDAPQNRGRRRLVSSGAKQNAVAIRSERHAHGERKFLALTAQFLLNTQRTL